jgi:hypothetical protein
MGLILDAVLFLLAAGLVTWFAVQSLRERRADAEFTAAFEQRHAGRRARADAGMAPRHPEVPGPALAPDDDATYLEWLDGFLADLAGEPDDAEHDQ